MENALGGTIHFMASMTYCNTNAKYYYHVSSNGKSNKIVPQAVFTVKTLEGHDYKNGNNETKIINGSIMLIADIRIFSYFHFRSQTYFGQPISEG